MTRSVVQLVGPSTGGIRRHVQALTEDLRAAGWHVVVAAPPDVIEGSVRVDVPGGTSPLALLRARRQLRALVSSLQPTVIHAHGLKAGWVAVGVDRHRTVLTVHNVVLAGGLRGRLLTALENRVVARSGSVIATSQEIADRFRRRSPSITVVAPVHEVAVPRAAPADVRAAHGASGPLVVAVGRLHEQKGLDVLVRAMSLVADRRPGVLALVAGDGPERPALERLVADLGVAASVRLLGARDDATDLMRAADVVAITSVWESGPLTLLEAGAVAAPVVTTPVGFVPEVVHDGVEGRIVPVGDVEATAAAIMAMMDDTDTARSMGERLRDAVRPRLDREGPRRAVEAVYGRVVEQRGAS